MKILKFISVSFLILGLLSSCDGYEDYVNDYDYTATYFGSQKPVRTIVADESMDFEVGVVLAGMRTDDGSHTVDFMVDTSLLSLIPTASKFTALPESYYTIDNASNFNIKKDHMRTVKVTMTEAFSADILALDETYALPLRIVSSSVDSIPGSELDTATIDSKDVTILVVKFISQYHGHYYSRGVQYELDASGSAIDTLTYYKSDLSQNDVVDFSTLAVNTVMTSRIGGNLPGGLEFTMNADGSVSVTSTSVTIDSGSVTYSAENNTYTIDITVDKAGIKYKIEEELILRQNPELDLRFEEW